MGKRSSRNRNQKNLTRTDKDQRFALAMKKWDVLQKVLIAGLKVAGVVAAIYFGVALPIKYSAGKTTIISYTVQWLKEMRVEVAVSYTAAIACFGWAVAERRKRLRERKERDERIEKLERKCDNNRSSSGLTVDGRVKKEG